MMGGMDRRGIGRWGCSHGNCSEHTAIAGAAEWKCQENLPHKRSTTVKYMAN